MRVNLTDLSRALNLTFGPSPYTRRLQHRHTMSLPRAFAMTDPAKSNNLERLVEIVKSEFVIIFRHYDDPNRESLARDVVGRAHRKGVRILIADDPAMALRLSADGVHLPGYRLRSIAAVGRARLRPDWLITCAAHSRQELAAAERAGADAALLSPVFAATSRIERPPIGAIKFAALARHVNIPVYALGGISQDKVGRLRGSGAAGIAGIGLFNSTS